MMIHRRWSLDRVLSSGFRGLSGERLAPIRSSERCSATRQFAGLCGVVGMVVSVRRWRFAEPRIRRRWKVRVTTSTASAAAPAASARLVAQIRRRSWYHTTCGSCKPFGSVPIFLSFTFPLPLSLSTFLSTNCKLASMDIIFW